MEIGFDREKYFAMQTQHILQRIDKFDGKLYLEFGGKLFDDFHASRVLPGFRPDEKLRLLQGFKEKAEIIISISAKDIQKNKIRGDLGITYDLDVLRLIDNLRRMELTVSSIVITQFDGQQGAEIFRKKLLNRGEKVYYHYPIKDYPTNVDLIVSDDGFGKNDYVPTTRPLVIVTAPGPGSGKMATCLSQLYHDHKRGVKAGYAKFETFPIWNLPLRHPVNLAYEAATADLNDVNMIDPFHLEAYGETKVNYKRDVEVFPIVSKILEEITGEKDLYRSPTDMGVNMVGNCICDDEVVKEAAYQEIIRRLYMAQCDLLRGRAKEETVKKIELIFRQSGLSTARRRVIAPALEKAELSGGRAMALELSDGRIITGRNTDLISAAGACLLNSIKALAGISDNVLLMAPAVLQPILGLKHNTLHSKNPVLSAEEVLLALGICAVTNPTAELALSKLCELKDCEAHASVLMGQSDEGILRKLGIRLTCEPVFPTKDLFYL